MPFTLIKGTFKPTVGTPDGDSVRFQADDLSLWDRLEGAKVRVSTSGATKDTAQLRFEGIDAIEKAATKPLSTEARDSMFTLIGAAGGNVTSRGHILARMTDDQSGRPICFVFAGNTNRPDGAEVFLDAALLRQSVNYKQMQAGFAYPLYYHTLFGDLRVEFNVALAEAKQNNRKYWPLDATQTGVTVHGPGDLATIPPIWPKLWRRLEEYLKNHPSLANFKSFLEEKNERVDILSPIVTEKGLQEVVEVQGDTVRLTESPENIRVVGSAGRRLR